MSATSQVATCCLALTAASCAGSLGFEDFSWSAPQQKISVATPTLEALPSANVPAPDGLRATSGVLRAVPLKWDPMLRSDVAGYLVERAAVRDGPFGRAARIEGRLLTAYLDRSEADGETIFYRVRSYTPEGRISVAPSDVISATTALPPAAPEHLRAYSYQPRQVPLSWETSRDTTAAGYVVYRSPSWRGPFERLAALEGRHTTVHRDSRLESLRVFYYRVTARNIHGVEGPPSEPVRAVTKPEPLPPIGLRVVKLGLGVNRLSWEPNVETDITEYRLLRSTADRGPTRVVASVPAEAMVAEDDSIGTAEFASYTLVAVDGDGLESDSSLRVGVQSEDYGLSARAEPDGIHLAWNPRPDEGFHGARIMRRHRFGRTELAFVRSDRYVDGDVQPGAHYRYVVILERPDSSQAPPSAPIEIDTPKLTPDVGIR